MRDIDVKIHIISVGNKMPKWVDLGYQEYAKRLPIECQVKLIEIAPGHRGKGADIKRATREEGERMLKAIPKGARVIALHVVGKSWSTEQLAQQMGNWLSGGCDVALLIGGPEGLADSCLQIAGQKWSLSALTMPHPLVRVVLSEQLYRGWSLLNNHPYHRAG